MSSENYSNDNNKSPPLQMEDVQRIFHNYIENFREIEAIRTEIREFQKQFKKRLDHLKQSNQQHEKVLIEYMTEKNIPGLRRNDYLILCHEKPVRSSKKQKERCLDDLFHKNHYDSSHPLYQEVKRLLLTNRSTDNPSSTTTTTKERCLRCKRYTGGTSISASNKQ